MPKLRARFLFAIFFSVFSGPEFLRSSDDQDKLESFIQSERQQLEEWADSEEDLPPVFLLADQRAALLFAPYFAYGGDARLCEDLSLDELVELSHGDLEAKETALNTFIPRLRQIIQDNCLVRPGDRLVVIHESTQTTVGLDKFVVRRETPLCPGDNPYSLWITFSEPLESRPLLVSTDLALEGKNSAYQPADQLVQVALDGQSSNRLSTFVQYVKEFEVTVYQSKAANWDRLYWLKRKTLSIEDDGLVNQLIVWSKGERYGKLVSESVDSKKGTGRVSVEAVFDFDGDGYQDVLVRGTQFGCPYTLLFKGLAVGFERLDLPNKPCRC